MEVLCFNKLVIQEETIIQSLVAINSLTQQLDSIESHNHQSKEGCFISNWDKIMVHLKMESNMDRDKQGEINFYLNNLVD